MALTGVNNFNQGVDESLKLNYKELPKVQQGGLSENLVTNGVDLEKAVTSISDMGRGVQELAQQVDHIEDSDQRKAVANGMGHFMDFIKEKADDGQLKNFSKQVSEFIDKNKSQQGRSIPESASENANPEPAKSLNMFQESFKTANTLADRGYDLDRWVDTYLRINDQDTQKVFVEETNKIIENEAEAEEAKDMTFERFTEITNALTKADLDEASLAEKAKELIGKVAGQDTFQDKIQTIEGFSGDLLSMEEIRENHANSAGSPK